MSDEEGGGSNSGTGSNVNATIDAVTGLVKAVPVYQDAVQPAAKELGKSLQTVARAVNVALMPLKAIVWSFEKIEAIFIPKVEERLKDVPPEDIITPKPNVAGPALEALRYAGHEESLSDMYANLLATAMDKKIASGAHPAFVEIIKQFTPDEAKLMALLLQHRPFPLITVQAERKDNIGGVTDIAVNLSSLGVEAGLEFNDLTPSYLDNLCRLGLIEIPQDRSYADKSLYSDLESSDLVQGFRTEVEVLRKQTFKLQYGGVNTTSLGKQFGNVCISNK